MSDDAKQDYFADGMTEDLITDLPASRPLRHLPQLLFRLQGQGGADQQVAEELGVRYVLEGSIQRAGDRMRINAQLIDAMSGGHEWAERFDGSLGDVFALQDKVTRSIAEALAVRLVDGGAKADGADDGGTANAEAFDAYLRGVAFANQNTPKADVQAVAAFEQALKLDPDFGDALADLAWVYWDADQARARALGVAAAPHARRQALRLSRPGREAPLAQLLSARRRVALA